MVVMEVSWVVLMVVDVRVMDVVVLDELSID